MSDDLDTSALPDRFVTKVDFGAPAGCWTWQASVLTSGYGGYKFGGRMVAAHRFAYEALVGDIPAGFMVDHLCFVKRCVNPAHLRVLTRKQNGEHRRGANRNGASGERGVSWDRAHGKWKAYATHNSKRHHAGFYSDFEEARAAARALRASLFTHDDHEAGKTMNDWVSIKEAAVLANRAPRKIYEWVQNGRLPARKDEHGVLVVKGVDVLRAESTVRRGRPRGTVTRRADQDRIRDAFKQAGESQRHAG